MTRLVEATSEVAGMVLEISAAAGDGVTEGDQLMVLESMKMEIPVFAPATGRLEAVLAAEGESVNEGQVLARIAP